LPMKNVTKTMEDVLRHHNARCDPKTLKKGKRDSPTWWVKYGDIP